MKCSSIRLLSRNEYNKSKRTKKEDMRIFVPEETHSYCYPFSIRKLYSIDRDYTNLAITYISLPEGKFYNTGSSLEKWAKKKPRLKSAKSKCPLNHSPNSDENLTEYDVSLLLNELDNCNEYDTDDEDTITSNLQYEVHSDIQELLMKSQREELISENENRENEHVHKKRRKKSSNKKIKSDDNNNKKKIKKKLKKTIKFSLSKAPSPETEQVIRVDVVSNVTVDGYSQSERSYKNDCEEQISLKDRQKEISILDNEVLKISEKEFNVDEEFIVKCKQLALTQRKR